MVVSHARACASSLLLVTALSLSVVSQAETAAPTPVISKGRKVEIEYTLTLDDGSTVQSNVGGPPLSFVAGEGQIIPGLEAALDGKTVRERVKVKIAPEQAYGLSDTKNMQEVPLDNIPEDARKVGTLLSAQGIDGPIRVAEVRPDVVVLDYNHPLAGKALTFDVLVLSIN
ncbi:MAG: peptidylprolyl isomerase [Chromatiales bacterium]|jgi:FKBP-type peptidyl-prolyl cis-trans isomerase SlyD|nr:MAG: peptidylprolyl isomerase [Chromatiales bacterium]